MSTLMINAGVNFAKRHYGLSSMWILGLLLLQFGTGFTVSEEGVPKSVDKSGGVACSIASSSIAPAPEMESLLFTLSMKRRPLPKSAAWSAAQVSSPMLLPLRSS